MIKPNKLGRYSSILPALCISFLFTSCATIDHRVAQPSTAPQEGLLYYAPKHVVEVETARLRPIRIRAESSDLCDSGFVKVTEPGTETVTGSVNLRLVSDTSRVFVINAKSGWFVDNKLAVDVGVGGRLTGVNAESDGKLDDVVISLAKFAGAVAGAATGLGGKGIAGKLNMASGESKQALAEQIKTNQFRTNLQTPNVMKLLQSTGQVEATILDNADKEIDEVIKRSDEETLKELLRLFALATNCPPPPKAKDESERYFLAANPRMTNVTERIKKLQSDLATIETRRMDLLKNGVAPEDGSGEAISAAVAALKFQAEVTRQELDAARTQYAQAFSAFKAEKELGDFEHRTVSRRILEVDELLPASNLAERADASALGSDIAYADLHPAATNWFGRNGCLVVISADNPMKVSPISTGSAPRPCPAAKEIEGLAYVPAYPARIAVYHQEKRPTGEFWMKCVSVQDVELIHPQTRLQELPFSESLWGDRAITIGFNAAGGPVKVSWKGTSSAAALSKSLADGAIAARDEYANSVAKLRKIQEDQRAIELNSINSQIDQLNKQRELLEAQLALEATQQTYDAALEIRLLDAEIKLLKNKASILKEQAVLESSAN